MQKEMLGGQQADQPVREPYQPPSVIYEAELEVRAGSVLGIDLFLDELAE